MPYISSTAPLLVFFGPSISLNLSSRILILGIICLVNLSGCLHDGTIVPYGRKVLTLLQGIHRFSECRIGNYDCVQVRHAFSVCEPCRETVLELLHVMDENSRTLMVARGEREERKGEEDEKRKQMEKGENAQVEKWRREREQGEEGEEWERSRALAANEQELGAETEGEKTEAEAGQGVTAYEAESDLEDGELEEGEAEKRERAEAEAQERREKEAEAERQRVGGLNYGGNDES